MHKRYLVALVVMFTLAMSAVTYAAIPDSNGTIHGCYKASDGKLRVADSTCASGETSLDWNQVGPAGPQGQQGPPGPSIGGLHYGSDTLSGSTQCSAGVRCEAEASCGTGNHVVTGGGFQAYNSSEQVFVRVAVSYSQTSQRWVVSVMSEPDSGPYTLQAFATCANTT